MASVSHLHAEALTTNLTSYTSGSFTPVAGELLVVGISCANETEVAATLTDSAGGTYSLVETKEYVGTTNMMYVFVADQLVEASPPARTLTFTLTVGADPSGGCIFMVESVAGMTLTGAAAVVQTAEAKDGTGTTPTVTFAAACDTANPVLAFFGVFQNPPTVTVLAPFTELVETSHSQPASGAQAVAVDGGFTGTTVTWDTTTSGGWGVIAVELDASGGAGPATVNGIASLTSSAVLTAQGVRTVVGAALLDSSGQLTAQGKRTVLGAAQLASSALLVATGTSPTNTVFGTASLSSSGSLSVQGQREVVGQAQLAAGAGILTAAGVREVLGVATLTGSAILSAQGQREVLGSAALSSSAVLVAIGTIPERHDTQVVGVFDVETGTLIASFTVPARSLDFSPAERSLDVADAVRSVEYDSPTGASDF